MNKEIWLWLLLVMLPYNEKTMQIVEQYGGARAAAEAIRDGNCELLSDEERSRAATVRSREVNGLIEECARNNIRILTIEDEEYPELLRSIYNPPIVLFVQGSLEGLSDQVTLAVVGTRDPSGYGINAACRICTELSAVGMVIISGLALGLDAVAHQSALDKGGRTIGVLACGSLVDYPATNRRLKENILRSGGALISELLPHTAVSPEYFKHRNRIISGLAMGTFIVEAPEHSGCLLTAEHTIQQGRELFCLPPHDVFSSGFSGVIPYLRDGATPVFSHIDIINAFKYSIFDGMDNDTDDQ